MDWPNGFCTAVRIWVSRTRPGCPECAAQLASFVQHYGFVQRRSSGEGARRTIWGYEDRRKRVFRHYKGGFYELIDAGELVRYRRDAVAGNGILTEARYFSKTLDSTIRRTKRRARKDVAAL